jgi:hypothetical protein
MAEVIHIRELQQARERSRARRADYAHLAEAVQIIRENLAVAATQLRTAPFEEQPELLDRIEKLAGMVRYGIAMIGVTTPDDRLSTRG